MKKLWNEMTSFEKYFLPIVLFFVLNSIFLAWINLHYFESFIVERSGLLKQFQPMFDAAIVVICLKRAWDFRHRRPMLFILGNLFMALLFIFALGETITWGQRILEFPTPAFFHQYNTQDMFTIHNLAFGNFKFNKIIFGLVLGIITSVYALFGTALYKSRPHSLIAKLMDKMGIPISRLYHIYFLLICFGLSKFVMSGKKGEVIQFAGLAIFLCIFLNPLNKANFKK